MSNPYLKYYEEQAGSGLSYFSGAEYQKGRGIGSFLFKLFRTALLPALKNTGKFLGKQALHTGIDLAKDVLMGAPVKDAALSRLNEAGDRVTEAAQRKAQSGSGRRKRVNIRTTSQKKGRKKPAKKKATKAVRKRRATTAKKPRKRSKLSDSELRKKLELQLK